VILQDDHKSMAIQQIDASMKSSFGKFKDKTLDSKDVGKRRRGWIVGSWSGIEAEVLLESCTRICKFIVALGCVHRA